MRPDDVAAAVIDTIKTALAPVHERLTAIETRMNERMAAASTETDLAITRAVGPIRERIAAIEATPAVPGPQGPQGPPGVDGKDGKDGEPGQAGMAYRGVYKGAERYNVGDVVTYGGSAWHCNEPTESIPGNGDLSWTLIVKRGRDGRDGR